MNKYNNFVKLKSKFMKIYITGVRILYDFKVYWLSLWLQQVLFETIWRIRRNGIFTMNDTLTGQKVIVTI